MSGAPADGDRADGNGANGADGSGIGVDGVRRETLAERTVRVLSRGGRRNPDVLLVRGDRGLLVVKDFAPRGAFVRRVLAPRLQRREVRAWRALAGDPAVPRFLGWIDPLAFAVEYRPGRRMSRRLAGAVPPDFLAELEAALGRMHARGVAHLDLRHRSNVLVDDAGRPVLIDFGSAVCFRPGSLPARLALPWLARIDRAALGKWGARLRPPADQPEPLSGAGPAAGGAAGSSSRGRGARQPM